MRIRRWTPAVIGVLVALIGAIALPTTGGTTSATTVSTFGFMVPGLPGFVTPTNQELADLAQTQLDPNLPANDNPGMPSGFTYFGQFVDHDLTKDGVPQPTAPIDPTTLTNGRTFRFDLDSVYGGGPFVSPRLYATDHRHLLVQNPSPNGVRDLPRNADGSAILVEGRNDENEIISQLHTAFLLYHNRLADRLPFVVARAITVHQYQYAVLHDFLPHIVGQPAVDAALAAAQPFTPGAGQPMTPVEFSVGAYRFGHSMVRLAYEVNETTGKIQVFNLTNTGPDGFGDLRGGRPLPSTRQIDWGNFFSELTDPADTDGINMSRKIDTLISRSLFVLPIPGAEATGSNVLAFRNMLRAKFYGMASGQKVARALGVPVIPASAFHDQLGNPLPAAFATDTPLWYYVLGEAAATTGGTRLGPLGARIVADTFVNVLERDPTSILYTRVTPPVGHRSIADFLVDAGVADRP